MNLEFEPVAKKEKEITPKSVLARHYTDYNPEKLRRIYEEAKLRLLT